VTNVTLHHGVIFERSQYPNNDYCFNNRSINVTVDDISTVMCHKNTEMDEHINSTVGRGHFYAVDQNIIRVVKMTG
jgi:hypothetical protein